MSRSTHLTTAIAASACIFQTITTSITLWLACQLHTPSALGLTSTASALDFIALFALLAMLASFVRAPASKTFDRLWAVGATTCITSTVFTISSMGFVLALSGHESKSEKIVDNLTVPSATGLIISAVNIMPVTTAFIWVRTRRAMERQPLHDSQKGCASPSEIASKPGFTIQMVTVTSISAGGRQTTSSSANLKSSWSDLLGGRGAGLISSRPKLVPSRTARGAKSSSPFTIMTGHDRGEDDFAGWEPSTLHGGFDFSGGRRYTGPRLETIPGSRPVSPANALDGMLSEIGEESPRGRSGVSLAPSPASETGSFRQFPRTASSSRRPSTSDQAHIHPLFRSESPIPPPVTSPGTIITASLYAGQVIGPDHVLAPRVLGSPHNSRPASPSLGHVRSRTDSASRSVSGCSLPSPLADGSVRHHFPPLPTTAAVSAAG